MISSSITRLNQLQLFIENTFPSESCSLEPIKGDLGARNYYRIKLLDKSSYVVMDCPRSYASTKPFIDIAKFLTSISLSSPKIIKSDVELGILILEDFGDIRLKEHLKKCTESEKKQVYHCAIDLLIKLQKIKLPKELNLKLFDNNLLLSELNVFLDNYIPYKINRTLSGDEKKEFFEIWSSILENQKPLNNSFTLRDYHVENLMYLKDKNEKGINQLGVLDFQDALWGSPIYDLVSILEDARIDVDRSFALDCTQYYAKKKDVDLQNILTNYHILGAQRNLRILGAFTKIFLYNNNKNYLQFIPRVLKYLEYDLSYSMLTPIKVWLSQQKGIMSL